MQTATKGHLDPCQYRTPDCLERSSSYRNSSFQPNYSSFTIVIIANIYCQTFQLNYLFNRLTGTALPISYSRVDVLLQRFLYRLPQCTLSSKHMFFLDFLNLILVFLLKRFYLNIKYFSQIMVMLNHNPFCNSVLPIVLCRNF